MELKKARDFRFTFQDAEGTLRVVYLQAQHFQGAGKDEVRLQATSDGACPLETATFVDEKLSTRSVTDPTQISAG